ncbi:hypothetical protein D3C73_1343460 [compost metagenome]
MLAVQQLYPAGCAKLHHRSLHSLAVRKILADIIIEIGPQPLDVELGLLDRIIADDQLLKPGLALDQNNFILRHPAPAHRLSAPLAAPVPPLPAEPAIIP